MADIKKLIEQKKKQLQNEQVTRNINSITEDILGYEKQPTVVQTTNKIEHEWGEEEQDRDECEQQVIDIRQKTKAKKPVVNNTGGWDKNIENDLENYTEVKEVPIENDGFKIVKDNKMSWADRVKAKQQEKKRAEAAFDEDAFFVVGQETELAKKTANKPVVVEKPVEEKSKRPMFTNSNKAAINNNRPLDGAQPVVVVEKKEETKAAISFGNGPVRFCNKAKQGGFAELDRTESQMREDTIEQRLKERKDEESQKAVSFAKPKFFNKNKKEGELMTQGLICTQTTVSVDSAVRKISEKENSKNTDNKLKDPKKAVSVIAAAWD